MHRTAVPYNLDKNTFIFRRPHFLFCNLDLQVTYEMTDLRNNPNYIRWAKGLSEISWNYSFNKKKEAYRIFPSSSYPFSTTVHFIMPSKTRNNKLNFVYKYLLYCIHIFYYIFLIALWVIWLSDINGNYIHSTTLLLCKGAHQTPIGDKIFVQYSLMLKNWKISLLWGKVLTDIWICYAYLRSI